MYCIRKADTRHKREIHKLVAGANMGRPLNELAKKLWFVKENGRIVACIGGEFIDDDTFIMQHLAVEKAYRKRGIGMTLFNHAVGYATKNGATTRSVLTMYYHFRRFKRRGFRTLPRKLLPDSLRNFWMYTEKRYMKCAAMIQVFSC